MRSEAEFALALRQQSLVARSATLRGALAEQAQTLEAPLAAADRVRAGVRWLYEQRVWIGVAVLAVLIVRPRRAWRVARWSWWLWRNARRAQVWLAGPGRAAQTR